MAKIRVTVRGGVEDNELLMYEGEDRDRAAALVSAIVASGGASAIVITTSGAPTTKKPEQPRKPAESAPPASGPGVFPPKKAD